LVVNGNHQSIIDRKPTEILKWADQQPWSKQMIECEQDKRFHQEGNVWTHTLMVCQELMLLTEWINLDITTKNILLLAALFHDIGKPSTSIHTESGIKAKNHGLVGAKITRQILSENKIQIETREQIVNLVRYHTTPPNLLKRNNPLYWALKLSCFVSPKLLFLLAKADGMGRISLDRDEFIERIELFCEFCKENKCFDHPFQFVNDHARFLYFRNELSSMSYHPYEDFSCQVTLLAGMPAAGKDFWIDSQKDGSPIISLDNIRKQLDIKATQNQGKVIQEARRQFCTFLRNKESLIFNATNIVRSTREKWIRLAHQYGAKVKIVYIERDLETMLSSNEKRSNPVPRTIWWKLFNKLDIPDITEAHKVIIISPQELKS